MDLISLPYGEFVVHPGDHMNAQIQQEQFWDLSLKPFLDRAKPNWHIVDVGAHVGFYSGYWAATGCRVTAIEGSKLYFPLLFENIKRNRWETVIWPMPIFAYSDFVWLREQPDHETHASNAWVVDKKGLDYFPPLDDPRVFGCKLDRMVTGETVWRFHEPIDFLKIDVQGTDLHVLLGAEEIIKRDRPLILIEFEEPLAKLHGHTADDYHQWATDHRYREVPIHGTSNCFWEPL